MHEIEAYFRDILDTLTNWGQTGLEEAIADSFSAHVC
jgi:hypothetical protein